MPRQLVTFLEPDPLGFSLADQIVHNRVGDLDALFGKVDLAQVAATGGLTLALAGARRCAAVTARAGPRVGLGLVGDLACQRVQGGELLRELQLKLGAVDPLGLGDEDPPSKKLELLPQPLVRRAELVALFRQPLDVGSAGGMGGALGGQG